MTRQHIEDRHQAALFDWARYESIGGGETVADYLIAIPNGGNRNPREAARLKRQGVKAGVSDMFLPWPVGAWHGFWIELKKPAEDFPSPSKARAAVSTEQTEWLHKMQARGFHTAVCYGWLDASLAILAYLEGRAEWSAR